MWQVCIVENMHGTEVGGSVSNTGANAPVSSSRCCRPLTSVGSIDKLERVLGHDSSVVFTDGWAIKDPKPANSARSFVGNTQPATFTFCVVVVLICVLSTLCVVCWLRH